MTRRKTKLVALVMLLAFVLGGCNIREYDRPIVNRPIEEAPVPRPELASNVYAGEAIGVCFPIDSQLVVTADHVIQNNENNISVMNYSAKVVYRDTMKDIAILQTIYRYAEWYTIADTTDKKYKIGKSYVKGDSGTPLLTKQGKVSAMLIGGRSDGTYGVTSILPLANYKELIRKYEKDLSSSSGESSNASSE